MSNKYFFIIASICCSPEVIKTDLLPPSPQILVTGCSISADTALLEYQGKYLLWSQWALHNTSHYLPFTLHYRWAYLCD